MPNKSPTNTIDAGNLLAPRCGVVGGGDIVTNAISGEPIEVPPSACVLERGHGEQHKSANGLEWTERAAQACSSPTAGERVTEAELAEIERLDHEATPGPWWQGDTDDEPAGNSDMVYVGEVGEADWLVQPLQREADAAFIARARTLAPRLAAEVRTLRAEQEAARAALTALGHPVTATIAAAIKDAHEETMRHLHMARAAHEVAAYHARQSAQPSLVPHILAALRRVRDAATPGDSGKHLLTQIISQVEGAAQMAATGRHAAAIEILNDIEPARCDEESNR